MRRIIWRVSALAVVAAVLVIGGVTLLARSVRAHLPADQPVVTPSEGQMTDDGYDKLPSHLRVLSPSSLVMAGLIHPPQIPAALVKGLPPYQARPLVNPTWDLPVNISNYHSPSSGWGTNEPGAAMHPTNPLLALSGGNYSEAFPGTNNKVRIENTGDGGHTWTRQDPPNDSRIGDGVPVWLSAGISGGNAALFSALYLPTPLPTQTETFNSINLSRSTDAGANWLALNTTNINQDGCGQTDCIHDREYLWTDHNPGSPYFGRTYLTEVLFSGDDPVSYATIGVRYTDDGGTTWSPVQALVYSREYYNQTNFNHFPALASEPDGTVVVVWHRGSCAQCMPSINVPNKIMAARSTDGGVTFTYSTTIFSMLLNQSIPFGSSSPSVGSFPGFRWSDGPNIAVDPVDGTLYTVWTQYRAANDPTSAGVYLSRSTNNGTSWSTPIIVNNDYPNKYQYFPWVQVSKDHTIHVTFGAAAPNGSNNRDVAAYYHIVSELCA